MFDPIGNRMKRYENIWRFNLTPRSPLIIRLDGSHFHTYTRNLEKPWSDHIKNAFISAAKVMFEEVSGLKLIYTQSDEFSMLLTDYDQLNTQAWFDKNLNKLTSVSSSILTASFNKYMWGNKVTEKPAYFDSRAFILPKEEVTNYFYWRQLDCSRNSISVLAQKYFSPKQLHKKNTKEMQEMLFSEKEINWNNCETWKKRGFCVHREAVMKDDIERHVVKVDLEIPIFSQDRNYIERFVNLNV